MNRREEWFEISTFSSKPNRAIWVACSLKWQTYAQLIKKGLQIRIAFLICCKYKNPKIFILEFFFYLKNKKNFIIANRSERVSKKDITLEDHST